MVKIISNDGKTPQTAIVITEAYDDVDEATFIEKFVEYHMIVNNYDKFDWGFPPGKYTLIRFSKKDENGKVITDTLWFDLSKRIYLEEKEANEELWREFRKTFLHDNTLGVFA